MMYCPLGSNRATKKTSPTSLSCSSPRINCFFYNLLFPSLFLSLSQKSKHVQTAQKPTTPKTKQPFAEAPGITGNTTSWQQHAERRRDDSEKTRPSGFAPPWVTRTPSCQCDFTGWNTGQTQTKEGVLLSSHSRQNAADQYWLLQRD